jgi:hypothetical protein
MSTQTAGTLVLGAAAVCLAACHDWDSLSTNFDPAGNGAAGGETASGGAGAGGGTGGAGGAGGASAPYCASLSPAPILCNDFDSVGPLVDWETVTDPPGSTVAIDDAAFRSAPRSLRVDVPASGEFLPAFLQQGISVPPAGATLGFDLRVHAGDAEPLLVAALQNYGPDCGVGVEIIAGGARAVQWSESGGTETSFVSLAASPAWSRVELRYDRTTDPATVRLDVDGTPGALLDVAPCADEPFLQVGALYAPPGDGWELSFDNLVAAAP